MALEVKDKVSQLLVEVVVGRWFLGIEVAKSNVGAEERDGIFDGRGISDDGSRCQKIGEGGGFEERGEEEVPLEVWQGEELFGRRHREPKTGDDPSFIVYKKILFHPSGCRSGNGFGWAELRASTKAFAGGVSSDLVRHWMSFPIQCFPIDP